MQHVRSGVERHRGRAMRSVPRERLSPRSRGSERPLNVLAAHSGGKKLGKKIVQKVTTINVP
eukprot:30294-Pelagococcus_subviridis.AAC.18